MSAIAAGRAETGTPHKPNKGHEGGACNRERCQAEPANWYNHGSYAWYCDDCREAIEFDHVNFRHWQMRWQPECGHAQFETREMMNARASVTLTEGGDAKRAPGASLSGAVPNGETPR